MEVIMKRLEEIKKALEANGASNYVEQCNDMAKLFKYIKDNFMYLSVHNILTATDIASYIKDREDTPINSINLGKSLTKMHFQKQSKKFNGIPRYGYIVKQISNK